MGCSACCNNVRTPLQPCHISDRSKRAQNKMYHDAGNQGGFTGHLVHVLKLYDKHWEHRQAIFKMITSIMLTLTAKLQERMTMEKYKQKRWCAIRSAIRCVSLLLLLVAQDHATRVTLVTVCNNKQTHCGLRHPMDPTNSPFASTIFAASSAT